MPSQTTRAAYSSEYTSFVSGSRPTAPIKTAIIRPTNFYEGLRHTGSATSSDGRLHVKSNYCPHQQSRASIDSDSTMAPLTPEADNDPLSDNSAVMYGTNATRRRKSKVEAWIENSSSACSEESVLSEMRPIGRRRKAMVASSGHSTLRSESSTLSKEEVDLSFENLCQELLALSASCTTLERMISNTTGELNGSQVDTIRSENSSGKKRDKSSPYPATDPTMLNDRGSKQTLRRNESFADKVVSDIQRKFSTDEICSNMSGGTYQSNSNNKLDTRLISGNINSARASTELKQAAASLTSGPSVSAAQKQSKQVQVSQREKSSDQTKLLCQTEALEMRQKLGYPNASTFLFDSIEQHQQYLNNVCNRNSKPSLGRSRSFANGDSRRRLDDRSQIYNYPSAGKLEALSIDVGTHLHSHQSSQDMPRQPIRDSLVTITSTQALQTACQAHSHTTTHQQIPAAQTSRYVSNNAKSTTGASSQVRRSGREDNSEIPPPLPARNYLRSARIPHIQITECSTSQAVTSLHKTSAATSLTAEAQKDHVAAAIITQCVTEKPAKLLPPDAAHKFHRSMSEPTSFRTPAPDRRASLIRSPSKKDIKGKQMLKVGMDFIRGTATPTVDEKLQSVTSPLIKDNLIMNNLDNRSQSKSSLTKPDKMTLAQPATEVAHGGDRPAITVAVKSSWGSDSVFEDTSPVDNNHPLPAYASTYRHKETATSANNLTDISSTDKSARRVHESLSSSFESEALDILASLKSANALKAQMRHNKFPTDVDPVTGSPRPAARSLSDDKLRLAEDRNMLALQQAAVGSRIPHQSYPGSNKSSCLSSPTTSSPPSMLQVQHRSPLSQTPSSRRSRQSFYDNVLQSPFGGLRISVASGSSTGTVFSRPWGDLPRWEEYFPHNDEFRYRLGSAVSSQGRITDNPGDHAMSSPLRSFIASHHNHNHSISSAQHQHRINQNKDGSYAGCRSPGSSRNIISADPNLASIPRFPISSVPDVALEANIGTTLNSRRNNWEESLDRALTRVRTFTKLLQTADRNTCEITRYAHILLSDNHSLPGSLVGRFHTCTWETNSLDRQFIANSRKQSANTSTKSNLRRDSTPKTDWYNNNVHKNWRTDVNGTANSQMKSQGAAYCNGGYMLNTYSRENSRDITNSLGAKEHIVLSNVRQFIDGMKRYLLNQPDTQLMFAIQRERIKMGSDELINLDAIMEAVLQKVILQPLSDHLLNVITTHSDYSIREITQIESGMKAILNYRSELFSNVESSIREVETYEQTLKSVFQSMKTEFSPMSKLQYLLQMALLFVLIHNKSASHKDPDLILLFIYAMARYGDATLLVHIAYVRHLIPHSVRSGATCYILSMYETCVQVYSRIVKVPGTLARRTMILNEILAKLSCHLMIADEASNRVIRKKMVLSRWCTAAELIDIIHIDMANYELNNYKLYIATDEKEEMLRSADNISELLNVHTGAGNSCALVYRRPNTQMLLPPP